MTGFFKRFVDKVSGYSDDYDEDYINDGETDYRVEEDLNAFPSYGGKAPEMQYQSTPPEPSYRPQADYLADVQPKVVPLKNTKGEHQLVFIQPDSIKAAQSVCDHIRAGHTVICNIENVDARIAQRVIDFVSGAAHALDGNVKPIDAKAHCFVAAPKNVNMTDRKPSERKYSSGEYTSPYQSSFG